MFASRVIISDETKAKNQLNKRQQGRLRYKKLQELERSGELSRASTRNELAEMLGYPKGNKTGISWVNNMVNRGYISESLTGRDGRTVQKEFHLTSKTPDYDFSQARAKNKQLKQLPKEQPIVSEQNEVVIAPQKSRVVVEYCGMTITMENVGADYVSEVIKTIK